MAGSNDRRPSGSRPDPAHGRLLVVFQLRVAAAEQRRFLEEYQRIRYRVAQTDGYLADELCQSTTDPASWAIVSEWLTPEHFHAWERGTEHRELAGPLVALTTERRSSPYFVHHRTASATREEGVA